MAAPLISIRHSLDKQNGIFSMVRRRERQPFELVVDFPLILRETAEVGHFRSVLFVFCLQHFKYFHALLSNIY